MEFYKFRSVGVLNQDPKKKRIFTHSLILINLMVEFESYLLDLEVTYKKSKKERRPSNFHEFWSEEVQHKKVFQKR
jgi:hypothetical protein